MKISPHFLPVTGPYDLDRLTDTVYAGLDAGDRILTLAERLPKVAVPVVTLAKVERAGEPVITRYGIPMCVPQRATWRPDPGSRAKKIDPGILWRSIHEAIRLYQHAIAGGGWTIPVLDIGVDVLGKRYLGDAVTAAVRSGLAEFDENRLLRIREDVVAERRATARRTSLSDTF